MKPVVLACALLAFALPLAGCISPTSAPSSSPPPTAGATSSVPSGSQVTIRNLAFDPPALQVAAGQAGPLGHPGPVPPTGPPRGRSLPPGPPPPRAPPTPALPPGRPTP